MFGLVNLNDKSVKIAGKTYIIFDSCISIHLRILLYNHQDSRVTWKIVFVMSCPVGGQRGVHVDPNAFGGYKT